MKMSKRLKRKMKRRAIGGTLLMVATLVLVFITVNTSDSLLKRKMEFNSRRK